MKQLPFLIQGSSFTDDRGTLNYINDFHFEGIKRFYTIIHKSTSVVRAWQGHKAETKYLYAVKGSFVICWVKIDDWTNPSKELPVHKEILSEGDSKLLVIPSGFANGLKALEPDSHLLIFSDLSLEDSKKDCYRYDKNYWMDWDLL